MTRVFLSGALIASIVTKTEISLGQKVPAASSRPATPWSASAVDMSPAGLNALIQNGIDAYKRRDYEAAELHLRRAWQLSPMPLLAATLASTEMKLKHYRAAAEHWSAYLNGLPEEQQSLRPEALVQLNLCRKYVGTVRIVVEPTQAIVKVDGEDMGSIAPDTEIWLEPGLHSFLAHDAERESESVALSINPGDQTVVHLSLPPLAPILPPSPNTSQVSVRRQAFTPQPPQSSKTMTTKTIVLIGETASTFVALGIGVGYLIANHKAASDSRALRSQIDRDVSYSVKYPCALEKPPASCATLRERLDAKVRYGKIADHAIPIAALLGAITFATYVIWPERAPRTSGASLSVAPWWNETTKGTEVRLAF